MERPLVFCAILCILAVLSHCDIQTGTIDVNRQLGGLQTINDFSNVLCYTHIFPREFSKQPRIATSLTEFATDSDNSLQLEIRIRKIQLLPTQAKFMIFARKEVSIWSKLVFNFMASDRDDFVAGLVFFNVEDLSGCGSLYEQDFQIKLNKSYKKPYIAAFLNGFDVQGKKDQHGLSYLQTSIQITQKNEDRFTITVSRVSNTQIYTVSVSYIVIEPIINQQGYSLEVGIRFDSIQDLPQDSPFIFSKPHQSNINHAKYLVGFQKFRFATNEHKSVKSLALQIQQTSISIGSYDSKNVQLVQFSHIIIRQTMSCGLGEIIVRDPATRKLGCTKCDHQAFKTPNKDTDGCVCIDGFYEIAGKCYELPAEGQWSEREKCFVCNNGYTMMRDKAKDTYRCHKTPANKLLDSQTGDWKCINDHYQLNEECIRVPLHGAYDYNTKSVKCQDPYQLIEGQCLRAQQNQYFSGILKKFVCKDGFYRIDNLCLLPFANSYYHEPSKTFLCKDGHYLKHAGTCEKIPQFMRYDDQSKKLCCQDTYYDIKDIGCQKKPQLMDYDPDQKIFICEKDHHMHRGKCRRALQYEQWSEQLKEFTCVSGTYKIQQNCLKPRPHTRYSKLSQGFICIEGFYDIGGDCQEPPINMVFSDIQKRFICNKGFQQIFDRDNKCNCLEIPQNKQWCKETLKFKCIQSYYQLKDGKCDQPRSNERYDEASREFVCEKGHIRIKKLCRPLPPNSIYAPQKQSFICIQGYYQIDEYSCGQCKQNCLECNDANGCKSCRKGYQLRTLYGDEKKCLEVCGDGIRFEQECDDGNTQNGDGCSSLCKKQQNWICNGGSPYTVDKCQKIKVPSPIAGSLYYQPGAASPVQIKMTGMSHLYGKIILNVKVTYIPSQLQNRYTEINSLFRILTNSKVPLKTSTMYLDTAENTFVILYDFNKFEPIPEYVTRVQINPEMKQKYYGSREIKSLFIKINPAYMARRDGNPEENVLK